MESKLIDDLSRYRFKDYIIVHSENFWYIYKIEMHRKYKWAFWTKKDNERYYLFSPRGYSSLDKAIQILMKK